ncbi:hypothetical protein FKM82_019066 [Ascaphus truei]
MGWEVSGPRGEREGRCPVLEVSMGWEMSGPRGSHLITRRSLWPQFPETEPKNGEEQTEEESNEGEERHWVCGT